MSSVKSILILSLSFKCFVFKVMPKVRTVIRTVYKKPILSMVLGIGSLFSLKLLGSYVYEVVWLFLFVGVYWWGGHLIDPKVLFLTTDN